MALPDGDVPWWWIAVVSTSVVMAVAISAFVPVLALLPGFRDGKARRDEAPSRTEAAKNARSAKMRATGKELGGGSLVEEPWCPKLEVKDWQHAGELAGCPWNFDTCDGVPEVLERIWRKPMCRDLQGALDALGTRVKHVQVARVSVATSDTVHFAAVYTLNTGAELFGGAPLEHAVGLELGEDSLDGSSSHDGVDGLRQRRGPSSPRRRRPSEGCEVALPCLLPFYRIHDGFGVLLDTRHLPVLLAHPGDSVHGSCFYVYPARGLEPLARRVGLFKFARVDRQCVACADSRKESPTVVYVEKQGETIEDDEALLPFVADTVRNVAGQRVVPPSYMGGPGGLTGAAGASSGGSDGPRGARAAPAVRPGH